MKTFLFIFLVLIISGCRNTVEPNMVTTKPGEFIGYHLGYLPYQSGVYKIKVDSVEYIVVKAGTEGAAIIKHR